MAEDALACFNSLLENVPGWIADLESILKTAAERQEEILFASQPPEPTQLPSEEKPRSKSSSSRSRLSRGSGKRGAAHLLEQPQLKQHLTNSDALRLSQRKRKTASVCSGDQYGPVKYRTKAAAVVYYDGDTQKRFENLVRAVGSSRNSLRKGKMSAKVDNLVRAGSSSSEASSSGSEGEDCNSLTPPRLDYKGVRSPHLAAVALDQCENTEAFDKLDSYLDKAQALCERAAHQILRDGDCKMEVSNAKEQFTEALKVAEAELPNLQRKADRAAERQRRNEERHRAEAEAEERRKSASQLGEKIINVVTTTFPSNIKLEVDELEVDDASDDDDGEFNMHAMRTFGNFTQMRRLAAH